MKDSRPAYVAAVSRSKVVDGWREDRVGVVVDVQTNEIVLDGPSMSHSPRWYQERLWLLNFGKGELVMWTGRRASSCR